MIPYIGIDVNGPHVAHLRAEGYPVIYGNARHLHLWQRLNVDRASAAILTVDEHGATDDILRLLQHNWPLLPVIMRTRDTSRIEFYFERGAAAVVPETLESTLQLAHTLLEKLGTDKKEIQEILNEYRKTVLDGEAKIIDSLDPGVKSA